MCNLIGTIIATSIMVFMNKIYLSKIKHKEVQNLYFAIVSYIAIASIIMMYILSK